MGYVIRQNMPLDAEVRRVMLEQNRRALRLLNQWADDPRECVHQARQAFKRVRALLRAVRPGVPYVYRIENRIYRDLGRRLAQARDTEAVIDALTLLESRATALLPVSGIELLKERLQERAEQQRRVLPARIEATCKALDRANARVRELPISGLENRDLRQGVRNGLNQAVRALKRVSASGAADDFHALRKRVKTSYHQARLMRQLMPGWATVSEPALGALADLLGLHHDLVMLEALLRADREDLGKDISAGRLRRAVRETMNSIGAEALSAGRDCLRAQRLPA